MNDKEYQILDITDLFSEEEINLIVQCLDEKSQRSNTTDYGKLVLDQIVSKLFKLQGFMYDDIDVHRKDN